MKSNIIIINSFANTDIKVGYLRSQISHFKRLNIHILVISGCDLPIDIIHDIDYLILNRGHETDDVVDRSFLYKLVNEYNINDLCFYWIQFPNFKIISYVGSSANLIITKNIIAAFNYVNVMGYKTVFYTEDDNIFKDGSFELIKNNLQLLNDNKYEVIGCFSDLDNLSNRPMVYTTFFFSNIKYFIEKFTVPTKKSDWYVKDNILKYKLHRAYEETFYSVLQDDLQNFKDILPEINELTIDKINVDLGKTSRYQDEKFILGINFNVYVDNNKNKYLLLHNASNTLSDGVKSYKIKIWFDSLRVFDEMMLPTVGSYHILNVPDSVLFLKLDIDGVGEKIIDCDYQNVKLNGILFISD